MNSPVRRRVKLKWRERPCRVIYRGLSVDKLESSLCIAESLLVLLCADFLCGPTGMQPSGAIEEKEKKKKKTDRGSFSSDSIRISMGQNNDLVQISTKGSAGFLRSGFIVIIILKSCGFPMKTCVWVDVYLVHSETVKRSEFWGHFRGGSVFPEMEIKQNSKSVLFAEWIRSFISFFVMMSPNNRWKQVSGDTPVHQTGLYMFNLRTELPVFFSTWHQFNLNNKVRFEETTGEKVLVLFHPTFRRQRYEDAACKHHPSLCNRSHIITICFHGFLQQTTRTLSDKSPKSLRSVFCIFTWAHVYGCGAICALRTDPKNMHFLMRCL